MPDYSLMKTAQLRAGIVIALLLGIGLPIAGTLISNVFLSYRVWMEGPIHAAIEAVGAFAGLTLAAFLLLMRRYKSYYSHHLSTASALLGMGVLDAFHACSSPSNNFVWLRATGTLVGGLGFALVWLPTNSRSSGRSVLFPVLFLAVALSLGVVTNATPGLIPSMVSAGQFTPLAIILNLIGGAGFLAAAGWFLKRFRRTASVDDLLFASFCLLFGMAGAVFSLSQLWDADWWWWHFLRLAAYIAVLGQTLLIYQRGQAELGKLNESLERQVAERTAVAEARSEALKQSEKALRDVLANLESQVEERTTSLKEELARRRQAEELLRNSQERFELAGRATNDALWDWDVQTGTTWLSESTHLLFRYHAEEVEYKLDWWLSRIHPEEQESVIASVHAALERCDQVWTGEYRFRRGDGSYAHVFDRGFALYDEKRQPLRMVGSMMDITEIKRVKEELEKAKEAAEESERDKSAALTALRHQMTVREQMEEGRQKFVSLVENSCDYIGMAGLDRKVIYINKAGRELVGLETEADVTSITIPDCCFPDSVKLLEEELLPSVMAKGQWVGEFQLRHFQTNEPIEMLANVFIVRRPGDESPLCLATVMSDITQRKRVEKDLQRAKEAAETANRSKSEFLANMSHEIRTPMNGVLGMTELALDTDLTPEQRSYLGTVKVSGEHLLKLINDILDFSKIEAGKLELDPHDFRLRDVLGDMMKALALRAHEKGLELTCHVVPDVPDLLVGDALRLRQILVNLTGNAIKFTPKGEVAVNISADDTLGDGVRLRFAIRDSGIGIPADRQAVIFTAFTQADGSTTRQYGGTGLGLAISAQLVEMMDGRLEVESEAGKGSTFTFTARFGRSYQSAFKTVTRSVDLEKLPVLVVDDNETNRGILTEMLSHWRMNPTATASGFLALVELRRAAAANDPFPLVLIDALMPEMDGFTLVEQIRREPGLAGATILMLSSADHSADAARCRELGVAVYLVKPIKQSELLDAILKALGSVPLEESELPRNGALVVPANGPRLQILLAEDNEINQELTVKILAKRGHTVVVTNNGREAVAALERGIFDVVLMDVQMPEMDGLAATAAIRERERSTGRHVPIVALTAHAMKGDRERCLAAGMDNYVSKPLRADELFETLARLVPIAAATAQVASTNGVVNRVAAHAVATNGMATNGKPVEPVFDRQTTLARVEDDRELLTKMVQLFARQSVKLQGEIETAIARNDGPTLERAAHKLKGSLGNFGARKAAETAQWLEVSGRQGELAGAETACAELNEEMARLRGALMELIKEKTL